MKLVFKKNYIDYQLSMSWFDVVKTIDKKKNENFEKIYVLEHKNVYTAGKSVSKNIKKKLIYKTPVVYADRGGLWTWHGKGQVVVYFIYNLSFRKLFLSDFINAIEETAIDSVNNEIKRITGKTADFKVYADDKKRGFWVKKHDNKNCMKFGFMGLRVSNGFVYHGISINYDNDLSFFDYITPCGLRDVKITSIKELIKNNDLNNLLDIEVFKKNIGNALFKKLSFLGKNIK